MPRIPVFGSAVLEKALKLLGFVIYTDRGKGGHTLAKHPKLKPNLPQAPYITIRSMKEYGSADFRAILVREIVAFGFTRNQVINALNGKTSKST
jgi:predicted RNA binding protein YcfA (HicA-like mRNA interferase family)